MKPSVIVTIAIVSGAALAGCTGGSMGDTRGGGAAPGQSGGRDTTHAPAPGAAGTSGAVTPSTSTDTTKQRAKKQP